MGLAPPPMLVIPARQIRSRASSRSIRDQSMGSGSSGQGVSFPSLSMTMASQLPPQGWGLGSMARTRPETLAWT